MTPIRLLAAYAAVGLLSACAGQPAAPAQPFNPAFALPPGQGALIVYRAGNGFPNLSADVDIDGKPGATLARNEHAVIPLAAGEHLLVQRWGVNTREAGSGARLNAAPAELRFKLDAGEKRYLRLSISTDQMAEEVANLRVDVTWRLQETTTEVAVKELAQTRAAPRR